MAQTTDTTSEGPLGKQWPERRHPRLREPQILGSLSFRAKATLVDISEQGIGVECTEALPRDRQYRLTLRDGSDEIRLEGRAVWNRLERTEKSDDGEVEAVFRAGLRFDDHSSSQAAKVRQFIGQTGARPAGYSPCQRYRPVRRSAASLSGEYGFLVRTISASGALIETGPLPKRDEALEMTMQLPSGDVEVDGRPVETFHAYDESGEPCTRVAVEFQGLSAENQRQIAQLVEARLG